MKYNIFDINGTDYAAFYILSGTNVAVGMCHAENNGILSNCQLTNLYGFNYNNMPMENFTFSKKSSSFFTFSMKTKKSHNPYILTIMENKKDKKFYFHSFSAIEHEYIGIEAKIIFNLVDGKYYLHQIIEEYPVQYDERAVQQEFETKIVYDSNGNYNIPFGGRNK